MTLSEIAHEALLDALAIVAPTECSGCGEPDRALCRACRGALGPHPDRVHLRLRDRPDVTRDEVVPVWNALEYEGAVRAVLVAFKDAGRTDAARALSGALMPVIVAALRDTGPGTSAGGVRLAVIPSSRAAFRRRGYRPVDLLLRHAGLRADRVLRPTRRTADQAGLGAGQRALNRADSLRATPSAAGRSYLIVDDIMTTGSTIREAARALQAAGATVVGAAVVARTRRRDGQAGHLWDPPLLTGDI